MPTAEPPPGQPQVTRDHGDTSRHHATMVVHAAGEVDQATGAVAPPMHLATTFARDHDGNLRDGFIYSRHDNPTRRRLDRALAELEGAEVAASFASGIAAVAAVVASLDSNSACIVESNAYHGTHALLSHAQAVQGFAYIKANLRSDASIEQAFKRAASERPDGPVLVFAESPTNPMLQVLDVASLASRCKSRSATLVIDNTFATPLLQAPLRLGADLVVHSTSKFLGGHSDLIGGALMAAKSEHPVWQRAATHRLLAGAVPSPFDCWLLLRSLSTLDVRMRRQCESAATLSTWLSEHPAISKVHYPGLPSHPGHEVARRQMKGAFGAMVAFELKATQHLDAEAVAAACVARLRLIACATSLGGVHSLAEHRYRVEGKDSTTPHSLIRLSVGIEHVDDLRADLKQALAT